MSNYKAVVSMEQVAKGDSFEEVFPIFWSKVMELVENGTALMILEQACWVEYNVSGMRAVMSFYRARDMAYDIGILDQNGNLKVAD